MKHWIRGLKRNATYTPPPITSFHCRFIRYQSAKHTYYKIKHWIRFVKDFNVLLVGLRADGARSTVKGCNGGGGAGFMGLHPRLLNERYIIHQLLYHRIIKDFKMYLKSLKRVIDSRLFELHGRIVILKCAWYWNTVWCAIAFSLSLLDVLTIINRIINCCGRKKGLKTDFFYYGFCIQWFFIVCRPTYINHALQGIFTGINDHSNFFVKRPRLYLKFLIF